MTIARDTHLFPAFRVISGEWHQNCLLCDLEMNVGELVFLLNTWDEGKNRFEAPAMQVERDDSSADNFRYIFSGIVHVTCASDFDYVIPSNVADFFPVPQPIVLNMYCEEPLVDGDFCQHKHGHVGDCSGPTAMDAINGKKSAESTDYLNALYGDRGTSRFHRIAMEL